MIHKQFKSLMQGLLVLIAMYINVTSAEILFEDGFESAELSKQQNGVKWISPTNTGIIDSTAKHGGHSLEFNYKATNDTEDSTAEQRFLLGDFYKDIWISYEIFIPKNYQHRTTTGANNNKGFLMLWGGDYANPTGFKLGTEFWPNPDGSSTASIRLSGVGFDKHYWGACPNAVKLSDRGQWIRVVAHFKYATAANNDGIVQIWKVYTDGRKELACNITNGDWYSPVATGFDRGYILGWSNSGFIEQTKFYIDNFKVSTDSLLDVSDNPPKTPPATLKN